MGRFGASCRSPCEEGVDDLTTKGFYPGIELGLSAFDFLCNLPAGVLDLGVGLGSGFGDSLGLLLRPAPTEGFVLGVDLGASDLQSAFKFSVLFLGFLEGTPGEFTHSFGLTATLFEHAGERLKEDVFQIKRQKKEENGGGHCFKQQVSEGL